MAGDVFISYSRRDEEFVRQLVHDLEDRKAFAWIDRGDIGGGQRWRDAINAGIRDSKVFVVVVSPDALASSHVREEIDTALALGKPILPLIYRGTAIPAALDEQLDDFQYVRFNEGGYSRNIVDLIDGLARLGVALDVDPATLQRRRDERLGKPIDTEWRVALARVPRWALAWGIGWAIFWTILAVILTVFVQPDDLRGVLFFPVGAFVGGVLGGLVAGFLSMVALRHHASNIEWRHMSPAIRIWAVFGPIGIIAAAGIAAAPFLLSGTQCVDSRNCLGEAIGRVILVLVLSTVASVGAMFVVGALAGGLAVRHIRRLEPGIRRRRMVGVMAAWGIGSIVATVASLVSWVLIGQIVAPPPAAQAFASAVMFGPISAA